MVALRVDGEDESRQRRAEEHERREDGGQVDEPAREERDDAALAHKRLDVREVEVGAPDEAEEEEHVGEIERPARKLQVMRIHLARHDVEDECQPLHAEQRTEEAVPPDWQILAPQRQDAEADEHHEGRQREFIMVDHENSPRIR